MRYSVTLAAAAAFLAASSAVDTVEAQDEYWHYDSPTDYFGYPIEQRYTYRGIWPHRFPSTCETTPWGR